MSDFDLSTNPPPDEPVPYHPSPVAIQLLVTLIQTGYLPTPLPRGRSVLAVFAQAGR